MVMDIANCFELIVTQCISGSKHHIVPHKHVGIPHVNQKVKLIFKRNKGTLQFRTFWKGLA
jgi:uncharacterized protein YdhG (YjbR/CyaY superfamily)